MDIIFDEELAGRHREKAMRHPDPSAAFLLERAAQELADRLSVVERRFETAVELHGATGIVAEEALATGRIETIRRIETSQDFAAANEVIETAPLGDVPMPQASVNLVLAPLSLHLVNDLPGALFRIRHALKPDGLMLAAIPAPAHCRNCATSFCRLKRN